MTNSSSLLRKGLIFSTILISTVGSILPDITNAADGLFGTYFQRMIGTTSCPVDSVLQPFTNTVGSSYANRNCVALSTLLGNTAGYTAPAGQAVVGFSNTGVLQFASLGDIPSGSIVPFNLASCPAGWTPTNGTAGTPDLRGEFIRGLDIGRGIDAGRVLGSPQTDMFRSHSHNITTNYLLTSSTAAGYRVGGDDGAWGGLNPNVRTDNEGGTETRPRNVALLYCMKIAGSAPTPNFTWTSMGGTASSNVTLATTGRVGIGTVSPTQKLEVIGTAKVDKLRLGDKFLLSGIGDEHGNDEWLRLFKVNPISPDPTGSNYNYGSTTTPAGLAVGKIWIKDTLNVGSYAAITNKLDVGTTSLNYLPTGGNWNYTFQLNGQDTTSIGFHDAGASVSSIRYSNAGFVIGGDDGWGVRPTTFGGGINIGGGLRFSDGTTQTTAASGGGTNCSWSPGIGGNGGTVSSYICPNNGIVKGFQVEDMWGDVSRTNIYCCY